MVEAGRMQMNDHKAPYQVFQNQYHKWEVIELENDIVVISFWCKANAIYYCDAMNKGASLADLLQA